MRIRPYQLALERGLPDLREPYQDYGIEEMCWVKDADGNDLELMLAVPREKLRAAFVSGNPYRPRG